MGAVALEVIIMLIVVTAIVVVIVEVTSVAGITGYSNIQHNINQGTYRFLTSHRLHNDFLDSHLAML